MQTQYTKILHKLNEELFIIEELKEKSEELEK